MNLKNIDKKNKILLGIFFTLLVMVLVLASMLFGKMYDSSNISINMMNKKYLSKKINISNLSDKQVKKYVIVITGDKGCNYSMKFDVDSDKYIIKLFENKRKRELLNSKLSIKDISFSNTLHGKKKYVMIIRKVDNTADSRYLKIKLKRG